MANRAIGIARRENDLALELRTLVQSSYVDLYHIRFREGLENSLRAAELVNKVDDPYAESEVHFLSAIHLYCLGEPKEAEAHAAAGLAPADRASDRALLSSAFGINMTLSINQGDWNAGRSFADRGMAASRDPRLRLGRSVLVHQVGAWGEGELYLKQAMETISLTPPGPTLEHALLALAIPVICRIMGIADQFDLAETSGQAVLSDKSAMPWFQMAARAGLAMIAVERSDAPKSLYHHAALLFNKGTMLVAYGPSVDRLLGLLSHTMGDLDQAMAHFEDALAFCRKAGYRPELAWTCCDYADLLKERDAEGDRAKATSLLDEALVISSELGMRPLMERVLSRREILGA